MARMSDNKYGNQMQQSDEYGNPIETRGHTTGPAKYGQHEGAIGGGGDVYDGISTGQHGSDQHGLMAGSDMHGGGGIGRQGQQHSTGVHQRSGSRGSSSSEDDGEGGRRKKRGLKEKLTGGRHGNDSGYRQAEGAGATGMASDYNLGGVQHGEPRDEEKKGIMGKIKEKLPGHH